MDRVQGSKAVKEEKKASQRRYYVKQKVKFINRNA